jgi:hypothetical protein
VCYQRADAALEPSRRNIDERAHQQLDIKAAQMHEQPLQDVAAPNVCVRRMRAADRRKIRRGSDVSTRKLTCV